MFLGTPAWLSAHLSPIFFFFFFGPFPVVGFEIAFRFSLEIVLELSLRTHA